jgi:hypothetical protein
MKFINDEWLAKRAQGSSRRENQGSPTLMGLLKEEIDSLNKRVSNLNTFKGLFFSIQEELIKEKEKNKMLKNVVNQQRLGQPVEDSVFEKLEDEYFDDNAIDGSSENTESTHQAIVCIPSDDDELALSNDDLEQAKDLILLSLAITNEYNLLIDNLLETAEANSHEDLMQYLLYALNEYSLQGAIQIRSKFGVMNEATDSAKKEEYVSAINECKSSDTVHRHKDCYVFNKPYVSLLICGLPDDLEISERYVDYIKHVVSASNHKVSSLDTQKYLNNQHKNLKSLVDGTHTSITLIKKASEEQAENIHSLFNTMGNELGTYLNSIELEPEDKNNLLNFIASKRDSMTETLSDNINLDEKFVGVINQLKHSFTKAK